MDTSKPSTLVTAAALTTSDILRPLAVVSVYRQLIELRDTLDLQNPFMHVVRFRRNVVLPIPASSARRLMESEYGTVTMNDTDQILADLAEIL